MRLEHRKTKQGARDDGLEVRVLAKVFLDELL